MLKALPKVARGITPYIGADPGIGFRIVMEIIEE